MSEKSHFAKAQQGVAQSTVIAVQDATDNLRNLSTITTTAIGVALSQLMLTGDPKYQKVIEESQKVLKKATENLATVGEISVKILKEFKA